MHIESGEIIPIIGPNGSGKFTLTKTTFGLLRPRGGAIVFKDRDITGVEPDTVVRFGMSYIPPEKEFFPPFTVIGNLGMGASYAMTTYPRIRIESMRSSALKEERKIRVGSLSGGERRMGDRACAHALA